MFISTAQFLYSLRSAQLFMAVGVLCVLSGNMQAQQVWVQQGPGVNTLGQVERIAQRPVVGAVKTVATHPTDVNTIYLGAVNGGIWKTINATAPNPVWVEQLGTNRSLSVGDLAFDPTDATNQTLMAGSGRFSSYLDRGNDRAGVWRTTNGGQQWTLISSSAVTGLNITGVAPRAATLVVSADTSDSLVNRGIWRSTNTGATWIPISGALESGLPAGASFDLASDPSNNSRLFTNSGNAGIYRSDNTGATWTKVSDAAMDAVLATGTLNVKISVGRNNNVYVAIVNSSRRLAGLFRSGNGGTTWTSLDLPATIEDGVPVGIHPGAQGNSHLSIVAHPTNANVVFIGGDRQPTFDEFTSEQLRFPNSPNSIGARDYSGRLFRVDASLPAGSQSSHITHSNTSSGSSPHGDSRDMAIDVAGTLIETDDGGIYKRTTPLGNTGDWLSLIGNLQTTEFHSIAWDSNVNIVIGGAQDTGTPQQMRSANLLWESVDTADGADVAVDDISTPGRSVRYSSYQNLGNFRRRTYDASNRMLSDITISLTPVGGADEINPQFYTPIEVNNVTGTRLVMGAANGVYESTDQGDTVVAVRPRIIANSAGPTSIGQHTIAYGGRGNADMLYVGARDQIFVRRTAAPAQFTPSTTYPGAGTNRKVAGVTINITNAENAFVVDERNVYQTRNGGATWNNITGNLLAQTPGTLRSIAFSTGNAAGSVIVGTDNGVFIARGPAFTTWAPLGSGLPRVPVYDLDYDPGDQILVAGLLGRGAWTIDLRAAPPAPGLVLKADSSQNKGRKRRGR